MNGRMPLATGTSLANGVLALTAPWDGASGVFTHMLLTQEGVSNHSANSSHTWKIFKKQNPGSFWELC